MTLVSVIDMDS